MLVDALVHPIFALLIATIVEIAIGLHEGDILVDHIPDFLNAGAIETTVTQHLRQPTALRHGEEVKSITEVGGCHLTTIHIVAITLVDDDTIRDFHDASLDALQLIARSCHLNEQEEVDHGVASGLALTHANGLNENLVETCCLAEDDGLTRFARHTA